MSPSFWSRKLQCVNTTELNLILKSHAANQSMCVNSYLNNTEDISGNLPPHYPKKIWDRRLHLASWHTGSFEENLLEVYHSGNPRQKSQETAIKITKKPCFLHPTECHQVHNIIYIYILFRVFLQLTTSTFKGPLGLNVSKPSPYSAPIAF